MTQRRQTTPVTVDGIAAKRSGQYSRPASRAQQGRQKYANVKLAPVQSTAVASVRPEPVQQPIQIAAAPTVAAVERQQVQAPKPTQTLPVKQAPVITQKKSAVKPFRQAAKPTHTVEVQIPTLKDNAHDAIENAKKSLPRFIDPKPISEALPKKLPKLSIPNPFGFKKQQVINGLSAGLLIFSSVFGFQAYSLNQQLKEEIRVLGAQSVETGGLIAAPSSVLIENSPDAPSEEKPNANAISNHFVDDDAPRYLKIPKFGITARIMTVGENKKGAVDVPGNVHDVGWYNKSDSINDSTGAMFLVGHVSGFTTDGVFAKINQLEPGDAIIVELGDGSEVTFDPFGQESYDVESVDMRRALSASDEHSSTLNLNLMTCSGDYNADDQSFDERLLVSAKKI